MGILRHPRTAQEKRQNQNCEYCRPARRSHNLIDAWDDNFRNTERNWKKYRRTQYKTKELSKEKKNSSSYAKSRKKRDHWHLNHKCRWCYTAYLKDRCPGCENREHNHIEYSNRMIKKKRKQCEEETQKREREYHAW